MHMYIGQLPYNKNHHKDLNLLGVHCRYIDLQRRVLPSSQSAQYCHVNKDWTSKLLDCRWESNQRLTKSKSTAGRVKAIKQSHLDSIKLDEVALHVVETD